MIVELYKFTIGAETHLYTTAQAEVTYNGDTYVPTYVRREGGKGTESTARTSVRLYMARDAGIVVRFAPGPPSQTVELEVYQQSETTTALVYLGRVLDVDNRGSESTLHCESIHTSLKTAGLRRRHQVLCPYALYDSECGVNADSFKTTASLTATTADTLTASEFSAKADGYFTGGYIEWGTLPERRAIIAHTGDTVTLSHPLTGPQSGDNVEAYAGCDHTFTTCGEKFNNAINHGGMPWLPRKNPFGPDLIF